AAPAQSAVHIPESAYSVRNFCVRRPDGTYQQNPLGPYPDLNALPPKDYECYDLAHMLRRKNGWQSILTSRGCPYRCSYCFNHEVTDRYLEDGGQPRRSYLRRYKPARIIREIKELKARHPYIETIIFDDDLFTLNRQHVIDFCKAYVEEEVGIPFVVNAHVQAFSEPVARALSEAPCMIVKFGVESGSDELRRKVLDRTMSNQAIIDAFDLCHQYGLHTSAFLMFGLPFETRAMMEETIDLMARIKPGRMRWAIFFPFPGTKSYAICQLGDLIDRAKMAAMDNYFCASCLKFDPPTDLFIRKLQRTFHWYVNARAGLPTSAMYAKLVEEVERMSAAEWHEAGEAMLKKDRQISNNLLARVKAPCATAVSAVPSAAAASASGNRNLGKAHPVEAGADASSIRHYSIRYTEVMAVSSDFILAEKGHYKDLAARRWKAFRETIDESRAAAAANSPPLSTKGQGGEVRAGLPELHVVESQTDYPMLSKRSGSTTS
ncbi:MAG TPA: radical SAM protein, partial [Phycisphaerae bacterium]|nr:radical SAM protein [Phycisphaerae bacterium]